MALTTIETDLINQSSPVDNMYSLGNRTQYLDTAGFYGTTAGGFYKTQVTTAGTSNTTAAVAANYHGPHGLVYCTSSGYYTLAQPIGGCHLTWFHFGATDQFIRSRQAGSGATGPSFTWGTGSTYAVIETTIQAGQMLEFYGLSSETWLVSMPTSDNGLIGIATSS